MIDPSDTMRLFEIVTTSLGESFVRSYAWCRSVGEAEKMFSDLNSGYEIAEVRECFKSSDTAFITNPNDNGFDDQKI
jgi:hypothetical protein